MVLETPQASSGSFSQSFSMFLESCDNSPTHGRIQSLKFFWKFANNPSMFVVQVVQFTERFGQPASRNRVGQRHVGDRVAQLFDQKQRRGLGVQNVGGRRAVLGGGCHGCVSVWKGWKEPLR